MQTVIQLIETHWTKQSRGAPGARARNAIPEVLPIPDAAPDPHPGHETLLQRCLYSEHSGFARHGGTELLLFSANDAQKLRLSINRADQGAEVSFFGVPFTPTSGRPTDKVMLGANAWLQIVGNWRVAEDWGWTYRKFTYNIVHGRLADANTLLASKAPVARLDHTKQLW